MDDIIRSRDGALIVIGDRTELLVPLLGGSVSTSRSRASSYYELAKMDGAIIVNPSRSKLAYANVQLMPDPRFRPSNRDTPPHGRARRQADGCARNLHLAAALDDLGLCGADALPAGRAVPEVLGKTTRRWPRSRPTGSGSSRCSHG